LHRPSVHESKPLALRVSSDTAKHSESLFGERSDFFALGGASLIILPVLAFAPSDIRPTLAVVMAGIALVINHPHFMISYGIFYDDFAAKVRPGRSGDSTLHLRYAFAGIVVPLALAAFLIGTFASGSTVAYGWAFNVMAATVGWHYVKQGYGMAMVDAVLRKAPFNPTEKRLLRVNGYVAWLFSWLVANRGDPASEYLGVPVQRLPAPRAAYLVALVALTITSVALLVVLARRHMRGATTGWNGIAAYLITVYLWTSFIALDPLWVLVIPALHSFQYLWVTFRYHTNRHKARQTNHDAWWAFVLSTALGLGAFWFAPLTLDHLVGYDTDAFGTMAFLFMFWIFINVHHYFMDNVIWRRGNPDVSQFLFQQPAPADDTGGNLKTSAQAK